MSIRWIDAGRVSHLRSQSIYHGLGYAQSPETPNTVVMVRPENPYVCIGYFQDAAKEVDLSYCRSHELPVIRRETGGGAVFIDSGQLFVQWVCQPGFLPQKVEHRFQLFNKALIEAYKFFGIQAYHFPVNDVHVDGKKIVGTGAATIGHAEVVTGNFLFDFDTETMAQVLNLPSEEFRESVRNSLNEYMTWINQELKNPPTFQEVIQVYKTQCQKVFDAPFSDGEFTPAEIEAIEKVESKLTREDWLHQVKSSSTKNKLVKIHAGVWIGWMVFEADDFIVEVFSQMRNEALEKVKFHLPEGILPTWEISKLEEVLVDSPISEAAVSKRIDNFFTQVNGSDKLTSVENWTSAVMQIKKEVQKKSGYA